MGILEEPDWGDFVIKSKPLTKKEAKELSDHIAKKKLENKKLEEKKVVEK